MTVLHTSTFPMFMVQEKISGKEEAQVNCSGTRSCLLLDILIFWITSKRPDPAECICTSKTLFWPALLSGNVGSNWKSVSDDPLSFLLVVFLWVCSSTCHDTQLDPYMDRRREKMNWVFSNTLFTKNSTAATSVDHCLPCMYIYRPHRLWSFSTHISKDASTDVPWLYFLTLAAMSGVSRHQLLMKDWTETLMGKNCNGNRKDTFMFVFPYKRSAMTEKFNERQAEVECIGK